MGQCTSSEELEGAIDAASFDVGKHCNDLTAKLTDKNDYTRHSAARQIAKVTTEMHNRGCFVQAGAVPKLVELLQETNPVGPRGGMSAINNLVKDDEGRRQFLESGGVMSLMQVLTNYPDSLDAMAENTSLYKAFDTYLLTEDEGQRVCNATGTLQKISEQPQVADNIDKNQAIKLAVKWFDIAQIQKDNEEGQITIKNVLWCITMIIKNANSQSAQRVVERDSVLRVINVALDYKDADIQRPAVVLCGLIVQKGMVELFLEKFELKDIIEVLLRTSHDVRLNRQKTEPVEGGSFDANTDNSNHNNNNNVIVNNSTNSTLHSVDENVSNGAEKIVEAKIGQLKSGNAVKFNVMDSAEHFPQVFSDTRGQPFAPPPNAIIILDILSVIIQHNKIQPVLDAGTIYALTKLLTVSDREIFWRAVELLAALMRQDIKYGHFEEATPKLLKYIKSENMDKCMLEKVAHFLRNTASREEKRDSINDIQSGMQMLVFLLTQNISEKAKIDALAAVTNMSQNLILNEQLFNNKILKPLTGLVMESVSDKTHEQFGAWSALCILDLQDNQKIQNSVNQELMLEMSLDKDELQTIIEDEAQKCSLEFFEE